MCSARFYARGNRAKGEYLGLAAGNTDIKGFGEI